jgi:hypothetical protein
MKDNSRTASRESKTVLDSVENPSKLYHITVLNKASYDTADINDLIIQKPSDSRCAFRIQQVIAKDRYSIVLATEFEHIAMSPGAFNESDYYHVNDTEVERIKKKKTFLKLEGFQGIFKLITTQKAKINLITVY